MPQKGGYIWSKKSVEETLKFFSTSKTGLSKKDASSRLKKYGKNILPRKEKHFIAMRIFLNQWKSPLLYLLLIAAAVSFALGEFLDAAVIFVTAFINAIIGFIQEYKANQAFKRLRAMVRQNVTVLRDEKKVIVAAEAVVPGDIMILQSGDKIVADARLIEIHNFTTDESTLTGESTSVKKRIETLQKEQPPAEQLNMIWSGTVVARGTALAVVVETGQNTYFASIASLVQETPDEKTPLQIQLSRLAHWITIVILLSAAVIMGTGVLQSRPFGELFITAVAVAIAAIPEGLIVSLTIVLTVGMQRILGRSALVRKLIAAETLGSISVVCTDKTGTLTEGIMRVEKIQTQNMPELIKAAVLCNDAQLETDENTTRTIGDPTEGALLLMARENGIEQVELNKKFPRKNIVPFESEARFMATVNGVRDPHIYVKGAPEVIMRMCNFNQSTRAKVKKQVDDLAKQGLRILAFAQGSGKFLSPPFKELTWLGLVGMRDPVREHVRETIAQAAQAGVRTIMVTGDHAKTALAVARELRIESKRVVEGIELEKMSMDELKAELRHSSVFARVEPKHKIRIVKALQSQNEVVAMTGDGINDAPALKMADVGIAVGAGTDVTKQIADLVLLDNNFNTIISAIKEGRVIFENIRKVVTYLFGDAWSEIILVLGSIIVGLPLPVFAVQILWVNFIEDVLPNIALAFERGDGNLMKEPPRRKNESIINKEMRILIFGIGVIMSLLLFAVFWSFYSVTGDLMYARTVAFIALGTNSLAVVFSIRSFRKPLWRTSLLENKLLLWSVGFGILAVIAGVYIPSLQILLHTVSADAAAWSAAGMLAIIQLGLIELVKYIFIVRKSNSTLS